jgi:hypothetical protein
MELGCVQSAGQPRGLTMALSNGYRYGDPAPGEAAIGLGRPPEAAISRCPAVEPPIEPKSAVAKGATIALMSQRPF